MATPVMSQDIHWSQFNDNQLFQNPGHAGHFDGDYRFIGNTEINGEVSLFHLVRPQFQ